MADLDSTRSLRDDPLDRDEPEPEPRDAPMSPALNADGDDEPDADEEEIALMKKRVSEMEAEAAKLRSLQSDLDGAHNGSGSPSQSHENKEDIDARSIFVGNVDYGASPEEIQAHFQQCGAINRVTILLDKFTGHPKGYAYVEFVEPRVVVEAVGLDGSTFRSRAIKVVPKRTNLPGMTRGGRGGGGRGAPRGMGRGGGGFGYGAPPPMYGGGRGGYGAPPPFMPRGGGYRGGYRGRARGYNPY